MVAFATVGAPQKGIVTRNEEHAIKRYRLARFSFQAIDLDGLTGRDTVLLPTCF
jgi:hypothetical protein